MHRPTPTEAIRSTVSCLVRSGALDGPIQRLSAVECIAAAHRLTLRQADHMFTRYALAADLAAKRERNQGRRG